MQENEKLPDVQNTKVDSISINRVGVTRISFPLTIYNKEGKVQSIHAKINIYGSLPKSQRGTNMSRYLEILMDFKDQPLDNDNLRKFLLALIKRVETKDIYTEIEFKYFIEKQSPVSKKIGIQSYSCTLIGRLKYTIYSYVLKVVVPLTSVCPCSKEISKFGAHNQRGYVTVQIQFDKNKSMLIEDIVKLVEGQGSCEVYPILKRPDEKWVTETGYKNPKFVEDICRGVAAELQMRKEIKKFKIKVENFESIHDHNAVSFIFRKRKGNRWVSDEGGSVI